MKTRSVTTAICIVFAACAYAQWPSPLLQQNLQQAQMRTASALQEQQRAMSSINAAGLNANYGPVVQPTVQSYLQIANQTIQRMRLANQQIDNPTAQGLSNMQYFANMAAVTTSNAKMQGWQNGLNERRKALEEFRRNTGRVFTYTDRPVTPGRLQDEWDRCNRTLSHFPANK